MNGQNKGGERMTDKKREEREKERTLPPIRTYQQPACYSFGIVLLHVVCSFT